MKKATYLLLLPVVVLTGLVLTNCGINTETPENPAPTPSPEPISADIKQAALNSWETTPDGISYTNWTLSPEGNKVLADAAKIMPQVRAFTDMEAVVTSLTLPPGSRLGFAVMVRIDDVDYILRFDPEKDQLEQLKSLQVDDKIIIRSHNVSHAPKYTYAIISGDEIERDGKLLFKRILRKDGC